MNQRVPSPVQPMLLAYLNAMESNLPGLLTGFYLHGSLALDAFNLHSSDIDFVAVVSRRCTGKDVAYLRRIHTELAKQYPHWELSGTYLQWEDLGKFEEDIAPAPCFHDGVLNPGGHHDINSVTWWVLKNRGIALLGPEPQTLEFTVDWDLLIANMHHNLNTYWKQFTYKPKRMSWLLTDFGIEWTVLGVLRQYYTFRENDITSKIGAGKYALTQVPARWHRVIREAIHIREHYGAPLYPSRLFRALSAWAFLGYIIYASNSRK